MKTKQTIVITTGGTGGHIFPALALGKHLKDCGFNVILTTDKRGSAWLSNQNNNLETICFASSSLAKSGIIFKIKALISLVLGVFQALLKLTKLKPSLIIGFGSYASFPTMLAGLFLRTPIMLHEQNAVLGKANRFFAKKAKVLAVSFAKTTLIPKNVKTIYTGMPVRKEIEAIKDCPLNFNDKRFRILVIGGSQGASVFSKIIPNALLSLPDDLKNKIEITQQCRKEEVETVQKLYEKNHITFTVAPFFADIPELLKNTHLVIARAGSSTIAELSVAKRPAILVPLPSAADDHQTFNAQNFCQNGGGILIPQEEFTIKNLHKNFEELIKNTPILINMADNIANKANLESLKTLENIVKDLVEANEL